MAFNPNLNDLNNLIDKFNENFQCAVCIGDLRNTFITKPCAHRFCEDCIKKCINDLQKCPLCNQRLDSVDDIVKDSQFQSLMSIVSELKSRNEELFFNKLIQVTSQESEENNNTFNSKLSPLEIVLRDHLLTILKTHQNYFNQLRSQYLYEIKQIDDNVETKLESAEFKNLNEKQYVQRKAELLDNAKNKKRVLEETFNKTTKMVCDAYSKYLNENMPKPNFVAAQIKVRVLRKKYEFDGFLMKPNDDVSSVFKFVEREVIDKHNDKIIEYGDNLVILCFGPLSNYSFAKIEDIYENYLQTNNFPEHVQLIESKNCMPVLQYSIKPGSEFVVCGKLKFESDLPQKCFSKAYDSVTKNTCDYYQCTQCNQKWICKNCMQSCHKGHPVQVFSLDHKPQWGCCYCKKSGVCQLLNN